MKRVISALLAGLLLAGISAGATTAFITAWLDEPVASEPYVQPPIERPYYRTPPGWSTHPVDLSPSHQQEISTDDDE